MSVNANEVILIVFIVLEQSKTLQVLEQNRGAKTRIKPTIEHFTLTPFFLDYDKHLFITLLIDYMQKKIRMNKGGTCHSSMITLTGKNVLVM